MGHHPKVENHWARKVCAYSGKHLGFGFVCHVFSCPHSVRRLGFWWGKGHHTKDFSSSPLEFWEVPVEWEPQAFHQVWGFWFFILILLLIYLQRWRHLSFWNLKTEKGWSHLGGFFGTQWREEVVRVTFGLRCQKKESYPSAESDRCHEFHQACKNSSGGTFPWHFLLLRDMLKGILMKCFSKEDKRKGSWMEMVGWQEYGRRGVGNTWTATVAVQGWASRSELTFSHRQQCQPNTLHPHCSITELCSSRLHGKRFIYPSMSLAVSVFILDS